MLTHGMVKITVYVPEDLLRRAMKVSGVGSAATIRLALQALVDQEEARRMFDRKFRLMPRHK